MSTQLSSIQHSDSGRHYASTTSPGSQYLLPADEAEKKRLDEQHRMIVQTFDNRLVFAPIDFTRGGIILDSGTGTGAWTLDTVEELPSSFRFRGIDIESRLFPSVKSDRIQFSVNSVTDLPKDWDNTFCLVNQRFLISALQEPQWRIAIKELYRVLEPNGWIQLAESEWLDLKEGPAAQQILLLEQKLYAAKGLLLDIAFRLPDIAKNIGFKNITTTTKAWPLGKWAGPVGDVGRDNLLAVYRGMKTPVLKSGGFGLFSSEAEYDDMLERLAKEIDETPGAELRLHIFCAQKVEQS